MPRGRRGCDLAFVCCPPPWHSRRPGELGSPLRDGKVLQRPARPPAVSEKWVDQARRVGTACVDIIVSAWLGNYLLAMWLLCCLFSLVPSSRQRRKSKRGQQWERIRRRAQRRALTMPSLLVNFARVVDQTQSAPRFSDAEMKWTPRPRQLFPPVLAQDPTALW